MAASKYWEKEEPIVTEVGAEDSKVKVSIREFPKAAVLQVSTLQEWEAKKEDGTKEKKYNRKVTAIHMEDLTEDELIGLLTAFEAAIKRRIAS